MECRRVTSHCCRILQYFPLKYRIYSRLRFMAENESPPPTFIYVCWKGQQNMGWVEAKELWGNIDTPSRVLTRVYAWGIKSHIFEPLHSPWGTTSPCNNTDLPLCYNSHRWGKLPPFYLLNFVPFSPLFPLIVNCQFQMWRWKASGRMTAVPCHRFTLATVYLHLRWTFQDTNVYWTVHHCNSWRMKDQLDVTCYFISLLMCSTCFGH